MGKDKFQFQATFGSNSIEINIGLTLYRWEEAGIQYVYSPALDLFGYGKNYAEATESWEITFKEFVKYTHNNGTIFDELESLGWTVNRKKKRVRAPELQEMISDNKEFGKILKKNVSKEEKNMPLIV